MEPEIPARSELREISQRSVGTCGVTVAGQTGLATLGILDWRDVMVVLAELTVGSVPVTSAVEALSTSPGLHVKFLVKTTLSGPVVTLAG